MSAKTKISVFFGTDDNNSDDLINFYQLANSLANLELNIYSEFNKHSKLRILEFESTTGHELELWIYYGSIGSRDSIPAIVSHESEGIVLIGGESVQKFLLDNQKPIIWFKEKTGSQSERKANNLTQFQFTSVSDETIKNEFNKWLESKLFGK
ncbi:unnamed protein product [Oppiella nova]|uniref:Uncharacterized protein n=1 Tax=Oppiella nova TaxID=334625 RepID=A0A7R9QPN1_9ACAR|nr:unnamed protein product [Oppiella nova]CAG2171017.1 unnamed protein product [Oppiella nova]